MGILSSFVCLEFYQVIEHVADPAEFCKSLAALTIPEGATVISTINRSLRAYATAIVAAEYILRWVLLYWSFSSFHLNCYTIHLGTYIILKNIGFQLIL